MLLNQIIPDTTEVSAGASNGDIFISHPEAQGHILSSYNLPAWGVQSCSIFLTNSSEMTKSPEKILSILGCNIYIPNW